MANSLAIRSKETLNSNLSHHSADSQFQKVTLSYSFNSLKEVASIISSVDRRAYVREFSFSAQTPNNAPDFTYPYRSKDLYTKVLHTLSGVPLLHNLKVLRCSLPFVLYEDLLEQDLEDEFDQRRGGIVKNLIIGPADATPRELETLEIVNLPCRPQPDLTSHDSFHALLKTLRTLVLRFDYPSNHEYPYQFSPLGDVSHEFFTDLPEAWLAPASTGLTSLSLGANELWGYLLKVDFRDVRFPHLKSLRMQSFVFSHDWQLEWILSHKSLQKLRLHECRMLTEARWNGKKDDDNYPTEYSPDGDLVSPQVYQHAKSWHHYYEEFSDRLENLRSFTTDPNGRYEEFHHLGWYPVTPHPLVQAKDEKAFNLLQATINSRSGH